MKKLIRSFSGVRVLVVGDLMLDRYVVGRVERISPEAPVPVLLVEEEHDVPGGAANVSVMLAALGAAVTIGGITGDDAGGKTLAGLLQAAGVDTGCVVCDPGAMTPVKSRVVASRQQLVRVDRETPGVTGKGAIEELERVLKSALRHSDLLLISDYGKGVINPDLYRILQNTAAEAGIPVAVDPKVEHFRYYTGATLITPNNKEASEGIGMPVRTGEELEAAGRAIIDCLRPQHLLITRSEKGMALFSGKENTVHIPTVAREVFDVTGAGDMVIAVASLALVCGADPRTAAVLANAAAGIEVSRFGCQPVTPEELIREAEAHA